MGKSKQKNGTLRKNKKQIEKKTVALIVAVVLLFCATVGVLVPTVIIPNMKYNEAMEFLEKDKFDKATEIFTELDGFRDSEEMLDFIALEKYKYALRILKEGEKAKAISALQDACKTVIKTDEVNEIKYQFALGMIDIEQYIVAAKLFDSLDGYKDSDAQLQLAFKNQLYSNVLGSATVSGSGIAFGSEIVFGTYEQDGNLENGGEAIEWLVLGEENGTILLISKYALTKMRFADKKENLRWDKSLIRSWLNEDFYNSAFNSREKSMILTSEVTGEVDDRFGTSLDFVVNDKIYLFNLFELTEYFVSDLAKAGYATAYATGGDVELCNWWLREHYGVFVGTYGITQHAENYGFFEDSYYVRPVMCISYK